MKLDINTPAGQKSLHDELVAASIFEEYSGCSYIHTNKTGISGVDAIIVQNNKLLAVAETKCRYMDINKFSNNFSSLWLITKDKIDTAQKIAELLQTRLIGILYLVPSQMLLVKHIWEPSQGWLCHLQAEQTYTQATINGGVAYRENYFIDMTDATIMQDAQ